MLTIENGIPVLPAEIEDALSAFWTDASDKGIYGSVRDVQGEAEVALRAAISRLITQPPEANQLGSSGNEGRDRYAQSTTAETIATENTKSRIYVPIIDTPKVMQPLGGDKVPSGLRLMGIWLPIEKADKTITDVQEFPEVGMTISTSDRYWVREEDGRVYEAAWSEGRYGRDYWWDFEGESPVDPVEFMPHPLDPRFAAIATEGSTDA